MKNKFLSAKFRASIRSGSKKVTRAGLGALAFAVLLGFVPSGEAANTENDYKSTASGTGVFTTANNWSQGRVPNATDDAVFNSSSVAGTKTFGTGATPAVTSVTVGSIDVTATTGTYSIRDGTSGATNVSLILGGATNLGDSVSGTATDLLYAASGSTLSLLGDTANSGTGVLQIVLGQNGNFDAGGTIMVSSVISDGGNAYSLTKTGAGTLTLSGVNTYTGATKVSAGTLTLGVSGALTNTTALTVGVASSSAASIFNLAGFNQTIGSLQFIGGATSATSSITLGGGVLTVNGPITYGTATGVLYPSTISGTGSLNLGNAVQNINVNYNGNSSLGGDLIINSIIASGGINYTGIPSGSNQAILALGANNTFTSGVTINGGILLLTNAGALNSTTPNAVTFGSGAASGTSLRLNGTSVTVAALNTNAATPGSPVVENAASSGTSILTVNNSAANTFAGVLQDGGSGTAVLALTKSGAGTLALTGANTYSGLTTISTGTLQIGAGSTTGSLGTGSVTDNATLAFNRSDPVSVTNAISGSGSVQQLGSGTLTFSTAQTYNGGTSIQNGAMQLTGGTNTLAASGTVALGSASNTGKLILGNSTAAANQTVAGLTASGLGGSVVGGNASTASVLTTNIASNTTNTYAGALGGSTATEKNVALANTGAGTLVLASANNTYTGGTTISAGTVKLSASGAAGTGAITMTAGNLYGGNNTSHTNAITIGTAISSTSGVLAGWDFSTQSNFGTSPLSASTSGANTVVGGLTRGSAVTTSGSATSAAWGGTNWSQNTAALAESSNEYVTFSLTATSGTLSLSTINGYTTKASGTGPTSGQWQYSLNGTAFTDFQAISYSGTNTQGAINLPSALQNLPANTTVTFRLANYGGSATGTWYFLDQTGSTANDLTISGSVPVAASGTGTLGISEAGSTTFSGAITVNNAATLTAVSGGTANFTNIISGAGSITKTDAGIVSLSAANSYSGSTTISGGTLKLANASGSALTATSGVSVNSGTLLLAAANQIATTVPITLAGGTIQKAGSSDQGTTSTAGIGTLTLTAASSVDFTQTNGILHFKGFTDAGNAYVLTISNYIGTGTPSGVDQLIFDSGTALTTSDFNFGSGNGTNVGIYTISSGVYEVYSTVAVPEPTTVLGGLLMVGALGCHQRRRVKSWLGARA